MARRFKVTGYINVEEGEFDPDYIMNGVKGSLTEEAHLRYSADEQGDCPTISILDDIEFTYVGEQP